MASQVEIAKERDSAIERINARLSELAKGAGLEYAPIPTQGKDQAIVNKNQLVYIADTLDALFHAPEFEVIEAVDGDRDEEDASELEALESVEEEDLPDNAGDFMDDVMRDETTRRLSTLRSNKPKPTAKGKGK